MATLTEQLTEQAERLLMLTAAAAIAILAVLGDALIRARRYQQLLAEIKRIRWLLELDEAEPEEPGA